MADTSVVLDDESAMALALEQARLAAQLGEVPVGAVVVDVTGRMLAAGHNRTILDHDPTAHAEVVALRRAATALGNYRLTGARLYVTLEPCLMCLGAMFHARLAEIVYGANDPKTGACGGVVDLSPVSCLNHRTQVRGGILASESGTMLRDFFRARRRSAVPAPLPEPAVPTATHLPEIKPIKSLANTMSNHTEHTHWACPTGAEHAHLHESPSGIYLISPSGAVPDPAVLDLSVQRLKEMGYRVTLDRTVSAVHERFAGTDRQRLACIQRALKQKHPVVMATRGGYGLSRLLPFIDWQAVADSGKTFIGQSDFTAFSLALLAQTGAVSLAGPTALYDFGAKKVDDLTQALFQETLSGELEILSFETTDADPVDARGILWGGNLAMVASLVGTPYLPDIDGGILFLEDIAEHPFRIERMLAQLWHAGVLAKQAAIVLGHFTDYRLAPHDNGYTLDSVVHWLRSTVKVPVVRGLPYGHVKVKATLPVGAQAGIATEKGMAHLVLQEHEH